MSDPKHGLERILETVLHCRAENRDAMRRFYDRVLGLEARRISSFGYRLGSSVLLIFDADRSAKQKSPPAHGTSGRAHTCFVAAPGDYDPWKDRIRAAGVEILEEIAWSPPLTGRSFYFHDPAGNVLEIADRDIWPP